MRIIAFCGPPCSGKTETARALKESPEFSSWALFEMDELRLAFWPLSHTREDRADAYARMHELAADALRKGAPGVILVATYQPSEQRHALRALADGLPAPLLIFECKVHPLEAVSRFKQRSPKHAGTDLSSEKVWDLAQSFPYFEKCTLLDTTKHRTSHLVDTILRLSKSDELTSGLDKWVALPAAFTAGPQLNASETLLKLTSKSRSRAKWYSFLRAAGVYFSVMAFGVALALTVAAIFRQVPYLSAGDVAGWVQASLAASLVSAGLAAAIEFLLRGPNAMRDNLVRHAGQVPRLELPEYEPSNLELYERYQRRIDPKQQERFFIPNVPIWFLVPPQKKGFEVKTEIVNDTPVNWQLLQERAAKVGLDWHGYLKWRQKQKEEEYYDRSEEPKVRVLDFFFSHGVVTVQVCRGDFMSYLCTELSANLRVDGRYGFEFRELLEGPTWNRAEASAEKPLLDLENIRKGSRTHEMLASVQLGLTTSDGYLVLQRRSNRVQSAVGGVTSSGSGTAMWKDLSSGHRSLKETAIRETCEEIGWLPHEDDDLRAPFLATAFNLLRGRDLNFYCHLHTRRTFREIAEAAPRAQHSWEVAHLIPVPLEAIEANGTLQQPFENLIGGARHLRGLLYCLAQSEKLQSIKKATVSCRQE
jgi:predicted kinase